jgi:hypothetical protein
MSSIISFIGSLIQFAIFAVIVVAVIALFGYNKLRALSENVKEAFSNIGVTARKQVSLINQLIETVKGYADNEKLVLLKVSTDMSIANLSQVHQESGLVVSAINGMAQRFPDLKSNQQYNTLMKAISDVENELEAQRERYNAAAKQYNVQRTSIPHVFYSSTLGFKAAPYLDLASSEPQDMGVLKTISSEDGERLNELLGVAGSKTASLVRNVSSKALEHSMAAVNVAQTKIRQMQVEEYTYLDADKNPQGPVGLDALKTLREAGKITDDTPVMPRDAKGWQKYSEVMLAASSEVVVG